MKTLGIILVSFAFASTSFAAVATTPANGDPNFVGQAWGLSGYNTPKVAAGTIVTDEAGYSEQCPTFYYGGCVDITKTQYYRNQMIELGKQLKALGFSLPQFAGWIR